MVRGVIVSQVQRQTDAKHHGLDLSSEIEAVVRHSLGDTILIEAR